MKRAVADKIASVAQSCGLTPEIRLSPDIPAEEGVVVAVEILNDKATYNQLELASGRMAVVQRGDVLVRRSGSAAGDPDVGGHVTVRQLHRVRDRDAGVRVGEEGVEPPVVDVGADRK